MRQPSFSLLRGVLLSCATLVSACGGQHEQCRRDIAKLREHTERLQESVSALTDQFDEVVQRQRDGSRSRVTVLDRKPQQVEVRVSPRVITVGQRPVTLDVLGEYLADLARNSPGTRVTIFSRGPLTKHRLQQVLEAVKQSGISQISVQ